MTGRGVRDLLDKRSGINQQSERIAIAEQNVRVVYKKVGSGNHPLIGTKVTIPEGNKVRKDVRVVIRINSTTSRRGSSGCDTVD